MNKLQTIGVLKQWTMESTLVVIYLQPNYLHQPYVVVLVGLSICFEPSKLLFLNLMHLAYQLYRISHCPCIDILYRPIRFMLGLLIGKVSLIMFSMKIHNSTL